MHLKLYQLSFYVTLIFALSTSGLVRGQGKRPVNQTKQDDKPASIAFHAGPTILFGDLKEIRSSTALKATLSLPLSRLWGVELVGDMGTLKAEQQDFYNSYSECRFTQASVTGFLDVLSLLSKKHTRRVDINAYGGIGLLFFNARAFDRNSGKVQRLTNNENSYRSRDGIETRGKPGIRNTHEFVVPLGLRISTAMTRRVSISGEFRFNLARTDKLDATLDGNNRTLADGAAQTEQTLYKNNTFDKWGSISVGLVYYFGERKLKE